MLTQLLKILIEQLVANGELELQPNAELSTLISDLQRAMSAAGPYKGVAAWLSENLIAHPMVDELYASNEDIIQHLNELRLS